MGFSLTPKLDLPPPRQPSLHPSQSLLTPLTLLTPHSAAASAHSGLRRQRPLHLFFFASVSHSHCPSLPAPPWVCALSLCAGMCVRLVRLTGPQDPWIASSSSHSLSKCNNAVFNVLVWQDELWRSGMASSAGRGPGGDRANTTDTHQRHPHVTTPAAGDQVPQRGFNQGEGWRPDQSQRRP